MAYRGEQKIKGKIYVYEAVAKWNPKKKRSEQKRIYIGTKDPDTGELIPNKNYLISQLNECNYTTANDKGPAIIASKDYGASYLLNKISEKIGLANILRGIFEKNWEEILVCAFHLCVENEPLYLCEDWALRSSLQVAPSSQRISELLIDISEEKIFTFYKNWAALRKEQECLALDITSISSWSKLIEFAEHGYNRDHEPLPQINMAMIFGEKSRLPVFSKLYPGSIRDVSTLTGLIAYIKELDITSCHFVMDRGFYSVSAINELIQSNIKFTIGLPFTTKLANESVRDVSDTIENASCAIENSGHIYYNKCIEKEINGGKVYIHIFLDPEKKSSERMSRIQRILRLDNDLKENKIDYEDNEVQKYFIIKKLKNGTFKISKNDEAIARSSLNDGYFLLLTNESSDSKSILENYKLKDSIEKSFDNIKNDLDLYRLRIHSDRAMEGRIFIGFISLILASYIRRQMNIKNLYGNFTFKKLFSELKKLRVVEFSNGRKILTEISKKQKNIIKAMNIELPDLSSI